jgi:hypothetical protein
VADSEGRRTPPELREGVRAGILASLERDLAQRGGRTARRLGIAAAIGVPGALGATLLLSGHAYEHHPPWHAVVFGAVWTALLVLCLALVLLDVRTPTLPLARSAWVAMLGLGLAGLCGAACPEPHFLAWWTDTATGAWLAGLGGLALSALCFGAVAAAGIAAGAALLAVGSAPLRPLLPAGMLLALLAPGVALQSVGTSSSVFASWLLGAAIGAYAGVAAGSRARRAFARPAPPASG